MHLIICTSYFEDNLFLYIFFCSFVKAEVEFSDWLSFLLLATLSHSAQLSYKIFTLSMSNLSLFLKSNVTFADTSSEVRSLGGLKCKGARQQELWGSGATELPLGGALEGASPA